MSFEGRLGPYDPIEKAVAEVQGKAFKYIQKRYGPKGETPKPYHNLDHTKEVISAAEQIADLAVALGYINPRDRYLVDIAAAWHDSHQNLKRGNEAVSGNFAVAHMRETGLFSERETETVWKMIVATEVKVVDGQVLQAARPDSYLDKILADADLSNLGKPFAQYWGKTKLLYSEVRNEMGSQFQIAKFGLDFMKGHQFYTAEARELFPHQDSNLAMLENVLNGRG